MTIAKRYFVTGTDTSVGKTFVTCALARLGVERGLKVFAFKPIETGCSLVDGTLQGEDQRELVHAAGSWQTGELRGVYQFRLPAAPSVAAGSENIAIELDRLRTALEQGAEGSDLVLVEGAGGWRVPISDQHETRDLARLVGGEVLVVARAGLGTINHSLLTLEAIERDGFVVAALIFSTRPDDNPERARSNMVEIRKCWRGQVLEIARIKDLLP